MEEMEKRAEELAVEMKNGQVAKTDTDTVGDGNHMPKFRYDSAKSIDENASDIIELAGNQKALDDEDFVSHIADKKKEQISKSADLNKEIHVAKKTAEKIEATTKIDTAFYEEWKSVLGWGGLDSPSKKGFMVFMLILILPFFIVDKCLFELPIAIVSSFLGAFNSLLEKIKTFGKVSRSIAISLLIIGACSLVVYLVLFFLNKGGIINIW